MILKDLICLFSFYLIANQEVNGEEKNAIEQMKEISSQSSEKHCNRRFMPQTEIPEIPRSQLNVAERRVHTI